MAEIEDALKYLKTKQILFMDDTFTVDKKRVIEICNKIKRFNLNWGCLARVNTVDLETLKKMKESGCNWIGYGVETASQDILNSIKKGITIEQIRKAFKLTHKVGIPTTAFFIMGHLDDTKETILATIEFAKELDPTFVQYNLLTPYPGTELYEVVKAEKRMNRSFEEYGNPKYKDPVIRPRNISNEQLKKYLKKANRNFYFRPKVLFRLGMNALKSKDEMKRLISLAKTYLKMG